MRLLRRRWLLFGLAGFGLAVLACWSVYLVPPLLRGEHFFRGRPTSYWSQLIQEWHEDNCGKNWKTPWPDVLFEQVGIGRNPFNTPAVLGSEDEALPVLYELLHDDSDVVRDNAVLAFTIRPREQARPVFLAALQDRCDDVRATAALELGFLAEGSPDPEAWAAILGALTDDSDIVRFNVLGSILLRHPQPVNLLTGALRDPNPVVRRRATVSVAEFVTKVVAERGNPPRELQSFFRQVTIDPDEHLRKTATAALKAIEAGGPD
jgi:HEAT repeats